EDRLFYAWGQDVKIGRLLSVAVSAGRPCRPSTPYYIYAFLSFSLLSPPPFTARYRAHLWLQSNKQIS
ncbi:hypothetical protein, partial [Mediterranea massiliensis]|uniref:hypothetical protein n=1 Tax=Mediterranea massiliensis TaxID=1841865 RepID=UPI00266C8F73